MKTRFSTFGRLTRKGVPALALVVAGTLAPAAGVEGAPAPPSNAGTVLQTNLVSDLPGVAAVTDPNLVNAWGISEGAATPFWISDNGSGLSTLYQVPGASNTPVSTIPLVVNIPSPTSLTGGTPTGTVFNPGSATGAFPITGTDKSGQQSTSGSLFLFATEDGTISGWYPTIDPSGMFSGPGGVSAQAVIAVDHSANAVYKGLAIATANGPIFASDPASRSVLYATNFHAGTVEVFDSEFDQITTLPTGAFQDPNLPTGYAPFNVEVLGGKVYVTYALQDADRHDDVAGPHHGFVDVFNLDGTAGLSGGNVRLISGGPLDSPWGLTIAPTGFAGVSNPSNGPVLLVGNFGDGHITAFDAATGSMLGQLTDPDGEPIAIDGLWALKVGNDAVGGASDTVYFTAGPFGERHGLFGSLTTAASGSPEGPAESQWVQANVDVVQLDVQQLGQDVTTRAPAATVRQDIQTLVTDVRDLAHAKVTFALDHAHDMH